MVYRQTIDATAYVFDDLRDLLAKATPPRSGDRLAGFAPDSAEQMIAARMALPTCRSGTFSRNGGALPRRTRDRLGATGRHGTARRGAGDDIETELGGERLAVRG